MAELENTVLAPSQRRVSDHAVSQEIARRLTDIHVERGRWEKVMGDRRKAPRRTADRQTRFVEKLIAAACVMFVACLAVDYAKASNNVTTQPVYIGAIGASK